MALLQPAPETVALFDDVLLLSDGHVAYHGPLQDMLAYFEGLGFVRPVDVSLQEWVQELTGPVDQEVRAIACTAGMRLHQHTLPTEVLGACRQACMGVYGRQHARQVVCSQQAGAGAVNACILC